MAHRAKDNPGRRATSEADNNPALRAPWKKPVLSSANIKDLTASGSFSGGDGNFQMMMASDARLKSHVAVAGLSPRGLPLYEFNYVWGGPRYRGVMAQDVLGIIPDAVSTDACGYYQVDYSKIDAPFLCLG